MSELSSVESEENVDTANPLPLGSAATQPDIRPERRRRRINRNSNLKLKVLSSNVDSLPNKLNELKAVATTDDYDIICLSEIIPKFTRNSLEENHIELQGYTLISNLADKNSRRGVAVYVKTNLKVRKIMLVPLIRDYCWVEHMFLQVKLETQTVILGVIYRSPSAPNQNQSYEFTANLINQIAANMANRQNLIIVGDFNMPEVQWVEGIGYAATRNQTNPITDTLADNLLTQMVNSPTRYRENVTPSLLDLVITNNPESIQSIEHLPALGASDHLCIASTHLLSQKPNNKVVKKFVDYRGIREELQEIDWEKVITVGDIEKSWTHFKNSLLSLETKFTTEYESQRPKTLPYVPSHVRRAMNQKKKAWGKYCRSRSENHLSTYRRARNKLRNLTRKLVSKHEESIACEAKVNPKKFWKYVSSHNSKRRTITELVVDGNIKVSDPVLVANILNKSFSSNFSTPDPSNSPNTDPIEVVHEMPGVNISQSDVHKRLKNLDPSKAKGPDGIHPRLLKEVAGCIAEPLTKIFQMSLDLKLVPMDWKAANVMPVFKKGDKNKAQNYRPISLTSVISKVMEGIINDAINEHLTKNNLLFDGQHGFRKGRSIETNLIQSYNVVTKLIEEGVPVDVILLDQAKAFDKVVHRYLAVKLKTYKLHPDIIEWIISFLSGRTQRVILYDDSGTPVYSDPVPVVSGVPQGTKLGPTLFSLYINDSVTGVANTLTLFADDTKLIGPAADEQCTMSLQADLDKLWSWCMRWGLEFNADKCKVLHLGPKNPCHEYSMLTSTDARTTLESVKEERDLGVIIDNAFKFHGHIKHQVAGANMALGLIKRTITTRKPKIVKKLYTALVRPKLEFGSIVAHPHYKMDQHALESVQRRATKLPNNFKHLQYEERLKKLSLPTLTYRRKRGDVITMKKLLETDAGNTLFSPAESKTTRGHSKKLQQFSYKRRERYNFFAARGVPLWNSLSEATVQSKSIEAFKKSVDNDWKDTEWKLSWDAPESTQRK